METILTPEEITELNTTGKVILTDDLMIRMKQFCDLVDTKITESYEDSDWYNDPNFAENKKDKHIWNGDHYHGIFGVNPAVDEFCNENEYELKVTSEWFGTWIIKKK